MIKNNGMVSFICLLLIMVGSIISNWFKAIELSNVVSCFSLVIAALAFLNAKKTRADIEKYKVIELKREITKSFAQIISSWNDAKIIIEQSEITKKEYKNFIYQAKKTAEAAFNEFKIEQENYTLEKMVERVIDIDYMQIQMENDIKRMKIHADKLASLELLNRGEIV